MSINSKALDKIEGADILDLIANEIREDKILEYKRDKVGSTDDDRKEILADVSSFANASGGRIIYGIKAESGIPKKVNGISVDNPDQEMLRLDGMIKTGIDPRIPGLSIRMLEIGISQTQVLQVLIVDIPQSFALPHMVKFKGYHRFYSRTSAGKYLLDIGEIRNLFNMSHLAVDRVRNFRIERLSRIIAGETPIDMGDYPKTIIHMLPLSISTISIRSDLSQFAKHPERINSIKSVGEYFRYNFDGVVAYANTFHSPQYVQIFHSGAIEAVYTQYFIPHKQEKKIPSLRFERELWITIGNLLKVQKYHLNVETPVYIMVSLVGVKDYTLAVDKSQFPYEEIPYGNPIDRDTLIVPEIMVDNFEVDMAITMKSIFDFIWNAARWPSSIFYDEKGHWKGDD